jgi:hypothetical protein
MWSCWVFPDSNLSPTYTSVPNQPIWNQWRGA